jgi:hypothetical protein
MTDNNQYFIGIYDYAFSNMPYITKVYFQENNSYKVIS